VKPGLMADGRNQRIQGDNPQVSLEKPTPSRFNDWKGVG
jgi:hypothetical protein